MCHLSLIGLRYRLSVWSTLIFREPICQPTARSCCLNNKSFDKYCLGKYYSPHSHTDLGQTIVCPSVTSVDFYRPAGYCAEDSVGYLMKRVGMSIVQQADKRLAAHGLTSAQWGPLMRLRTAGGGSTVAELARWLQIDAGAMTRLLDRLEKKGLCKRVRSTADRRVVRVVLTPEGEAAIAEVPAVLAEVMNLHLAGFTEAEWKTLRGYLQRMVATGEAMRDAG